MWPALRNRFLRFAKSSESWNQLGFHGPKQSFSSMATATKTKKEGILNLQEVEKVLSDVRADNVKVIPVGKQCDWTDFMVIATGRSTWHVKNIAQALIYKAGLFIPSFRQTHTLCLINCREPIHAVVGLIPVVIFDFPKLGLFFDIT